MNGDTWLNLIIDLLPGLLTTLELTAGTLAIGIPTGILLSLGMRQRNRLLSGPALLLVELGRGFPVLVILYLLYFGLPQIDLTLTAFLSSVVGLGISFGAYTSEVFRAGLNAIPAGQIEAGQALGLSRSTILVRVQLPQAIKIVIPPLLGWTIIYFQASSLAYALSVPELTSRAYILATSNFEYLNMLGLAALLYAAICIPISLLSEHLSVRTTRGTPAKNLDPATLLK